MCSLTEIQDLPQLEHSSPNKVMRPFKGIVLNSVYGTSSIRNCVSQAASYCKKNCWWKSQPTSLLCSKNTITSLWVSKPYTHQRRFSWLLIVYNLKFYQVVTGGKWMFYMLRWRKRQLFSVWDVLGLRMQPPPQGAFPWLWRWAAPPWGRGCLEWLLVKSKYFSTFLEF